ncbi:hypothetical protein KJ763_02600 [Patescibacteria group bacterium]|nr:hypothetical protein [Patescibacteria group bacterium]
MRFRQLFFIVISAVFLLTAGFVYAQENIEIILFYGEECPHCKEEIKFLNDLKKEIPNLEIKEYEIWHNKENQKIFIETAQKFGLSAENLAVPMIIVGGQYLIGFDSPEGLGQTIRQMIEDLGVKPPSGGKITEEIISHPIFGKINVQKVTLPFLTIVLGTLDGFNPCSMWSLIVLLTLVIATGSRKKVWLVGSVFIITSAISYFLFMSAWLNAFVFLDYLIITRIIVGIIAIGAGIISIKEFITFKPNVCEVSSPEKQQKITERIRKILQSPNTLTIVLGVIAVAFSVNLIELLCSLGIPVIFTKTLAMYNLATWKYYAYIGFYDFFYMLDDIIVLLIAGFSMKFFHINSKYSRYSRLVAGVLMLLLGLIFLLKPDLLSFK